MTLLICGFILGWLFRGYLVKRALSKLVDDKPPKEDEIKHINVSIEKHKNVFYLYDSDNGNFLAQGTNSEEVNETLLKRFSNENISFHAVKENIEEVGYK